MQRWERWGALGILILILLIAGGVALAIYALDIIIDYWWFAATDLGGYYLMRLFYQDLVFVFITLVFFSLFFFNFWMASRFLGITEPDACTFKPGEKLSYQKLVKLFQAGSLRVYTPLSLILAIPVAVPGYEQWERALLFLFGPNSGIKDPAFGRDISFYLFSYPIFKLIQTELLIVFSLLFVLLLILYWIEKRISCGDQEHFPRGARIHLTVLAVILALIQFWGYMLQRYELLYAANPDAVFFGPGFVEMRFYLPMIWISAFLFLAIAGCLILWGHGKMRHRPRDILIFVGLLLCFFALPVIRNSATIAGVLQQLLVEPNELALQKPFIQNNVEATLHAYDLRDVQTREYPVSRLPVLTASPALQESLHNIPVWDRDLLDDVYKQLQAIRPYYEFPDADVDRYTIGGLYQQVYLAAREFNMEDLPEAAQNWVNQHLQYTHGYGLVMTPAAQAADTPMTWYLQDIPVRSDYGITVEEPGIYYGLQNYEFAIAPNEAGEIDHPKEDGNAVIHYAGKGGVPLSSIFRKLLFAIHFQDKNILFTTKTNDKSRILFRRNIREAIEYITPYFMLDPDPYLVMTDQRLYWIQDAYSYSDQYPYVAEYEKGYNYIRNSVKIVVDAYNGQFDYYVADPDDPIARAYQRIYPGLLKPLSKMPQALRKHIRYPKTLFEIQMKVYAIYHQRDPELFYRQEDTWEPVAMKKIPTNAYYLTLNLFDRNRHEFMLVTAFSPSTRDNLRSLAVVGCDGERYGRKVVFSFPKGRQIYGPSQISTIIDQDTYISQQITLWDQAGSEVIRGRMIILPIDRMVLYIQPLYLRSASRLKIPELSRLIVSQGTRVAMDRSLEEAFEKLENRLRREPTRQ